MLNIDNMAELNYLNQTLCVRVEKIAFFEKNTLMVSTVLTHLANGEAVMLINKEKIAFDVNLQDFMRDSFAIIHAVENDCKKFSSLKSEHMKFIAGEIKKAGIKFCLQKLAEQI